jgi:hypothetical protein
MSEVKPPFVFRRYINGQERAESIIHAVLWAYASRSSDTAAMYAMDALRNSLGKDIVVWCADMLKFDAKSEPGALVSGREG